MQLKSLLVSSVIATASAIGLSAATIEVSHPVPMRVFLPDPAIATGRAVVAMPGGGYVMRAMEHEGYDWAPFFNDRGIALVVVSYRLPHGDRSLPISDAEMAIRTVRDSAQVWHINPNDVGIMGSSAGGHLASTIATHSKGSARPDFQILFYPVITMEADHTHAGSRKNLLGENPPASLVDEFSNEKQVTPETPRAFIVFSDDDKTVPTMNGINYYAALKRNNVPASLHIYPSGGHGWGFRPNFRYHAEMRSDLSSWLDSFAPARQ